MSTKRLETVGFDPNDFGHRNRVISMSLHSITDAMARLSISG